MISLSRKVGSFHWPLVFLVALLGAFGIFAIYSATWMRDQDFWSRQLVWLLVGVILCLGVSLADYHWIRKGALPLYIAGLAALVLTHFLGAKVYGARSWLDLGIINFQPSQLAILAAIMVMALFLSDYESMPAPLRIALCGVIAAAPGILILIQPDLGSAIVWMPVILAMLYAARIPARYLITLILLAVAFIPLMVNFGLRPYQRQRIVTFLDPDLDPRGAGWTINQSLTAIGSGGWDGKGFKAPNTLNELGFLPSTIVHNDFIFSVIGEQHGFIGGFLLLLAFAALIGAGLYISLRAKDDLGRLLAVGVTTLLFTHVFMNIGMTIGVTPITGLPLPLISYGGSFLLTVLFSVGLLQSIWIHSRPARRKSAW
ncbi:MAG: rod shape-determining protein RodA [Chthoniobacterales bacterium]|nr:rod shape-determining protein RodA [Chthoniobacterales bacterium]